MKEGKVRPCLDIREGRVVKGVKFVDLRDARDPVEAAEAYCREGADELVFLDIFATVQDRKTRLEWVKRVADVVTVPFAVGGGIGSIEDMKELFMIVRELILTYQTEVIIMWIQIMILFLRPFWWWIAAGK